MAKYQLFSHIIYRVIKLREDWINMAVIVGKFREDQKNIGDCEV